MGGSTRPTKLPEAPRSRNPILVVMRSLMRLMVRLSLLKHVTAAP